MSSGRPERVADIDVESRGWRCRCRSSALRRHWVGLVAPVDLCEPWLMIFGDRFEPAAAAVPTGWIEQSCHGDQWTVGALVPNHYELALRVYPPAPSRDWWSAHRVLHEVVAFVGDRHTSTPDRAFFAIRTALARIPTFDRPHRTYYLLEGPVAAVTDLRYPGCEDWRNPDLVWPEDRHWFVATDVDFWSLFIGGSSDFTAELAQSVPTRSAPVDFALRLEIEN